MPLRLARTPVGTGWSSRPASASSTPIAACGLPASSSGRISRRRIARISLQRERPWSEASGVRAGAAAAIRSAMLVLDSGALSRLMQAEPVVLGHAGEHRPGDLFVAPPVAAEIQFGIARLRAGSRRAHGYLELARHFRHGLTLARTISSSNARGVVRTRKRRGRVESLRPVYSREHPREDRCRLPRWPSSGTSTAR